MVPDALGTTTRADCGELDEELEGSTVGRSLGGSTGLFGVGTKRCGRATDASSVSYGKYEAFGRPWVLLVLSNRRKIGMSIHLLRDSQCRV